MNNFKLSQTKLSYFCLIYDLASFVCGHNLINITNPLITFLNFRQSVIYGMIFVLDIRENIVIITLNISSIILQPTDELKRFVFFINKKS